MALVRLSDLDGGDRAAALTALEDIFFLSTTRAAFADDVARAEFLDTWTGWYVEEAPQDVWLHRDDDGFFAGYLTGCRDSAGADRLHAIVPRYDVFAHRFKEFPAHLHINVHPDRRGDGVGAGLIAAFAADCAAERRAGVHVVTGADARNIPFYTRNGFTEAERHGALLFLGRRL